MDKKCLECGVPFTGRSDKKFCSDQCRTTWYNRENADSTNYMRNVNRILRRNRKILADLNPTGKSKAGKVKMLEMGFNFHYFTNVYKTKTGNIYYFCYEQGYLPIEDNQFALVIREEYVS
jgi:predicted nucleic acid-binding Zn ribbon protein